jgi:hypothetical protein
MCKVTLLVLGLTIGATQGAMAASSPSAASELIRQVEDLLMLAKPGELRMLEPSAKAIPRKNTADANMTAPVAEVGELMFLPDGHPFRVVVLSYPNQIVPIICRDNLATGPCGTLRVGQRISTVNDIATFQEGFYHNLSLFYVRTLKTR